MKTSDLISALNRLKVQTGSLDCKGCGYERYCSAQVCCVIQRAVDKLCGMEWIDAKVELPPDDATKFLAISKFGHIMIAERRAWDSGWLVGGLQISRDIKFWMPLPGMPEVNQSG
ncbi:MAG: hypothetical protein KH050_08610 [Clostridiaceae bacterium]|nr:hypothetical protein [Clostridiaceae bacterium]